MRKTVVGLIGSFDEARDLVDDLIKDGFSHEAIGMIAKEPEGGSQDEARKEQVSDEQIKGVKVGVQAGAAVGGFAGLLIGIVGITLPGIGAVVAAGPIAAALGGAGLGAVTGGVYGAIRNLGVPEEEVEYYTEEIQRGGVLVSVETDEDGAERAKGIMARHGVVDKNIRGGTGAGEDRGERGRPPL